MSYEEITVGDFAAHCVGDFLYLVDTEELTRNCALTIVPQLSPHNFPVCNVHLRFDTNDTDTAQHETIVKTLKAAIKLAELWDQLDDFNDD